MKEKMEHLFGHIIRETLTAKSPREFDRKKKEIEALQKFLDGFKKEPAK